MIIDYFEFIFSRVYFFYRIDDANIGKKSESQSRGESGREKKIEPEKSVLKLNEMKKKRYKNV